MLPLYLTAEISLSNKISGRHLMHLIQRCKVACNCQSMSRWMRPCLITATATLPNVYNNFLKLNGNPAVHPKNPQRLSLRVTSKRKLMTTWTNFNLAMTLRRQQTVPLWKITQPSSTLLSPVPKMRTQSIKIQTDMKRMSDANKLLDKLNY